MRRRRRKRRRFNRPKQLCRNGFIRLLKGVAVVRESFSNETCGCAVVLHCGERNIGDETRRRIGVELLGGG